MIHEVHVHACGHACACAVADASECVADAIAGTQVLGEREAIWRQRWPAQHPHPVDGPELPDQHRRAGG